MSDIIQSGEVREALQAYDTGSGGLHVVIVNEDGSHGVQTLGEDFPLGQACDLSGEGTCDSCQ